VTEPAGDGSRVYARRDQFGGVEVTQVLQGRVDAESGGHALVALRRCVELQGLQPIGRRREHEGSRRELNAKLGGLPAHPRNSLAERCCGLWVGHDSAVLVGLGVLGDELAVHLVYGLADVDDLAALRIEVEMLEA